ncbi:MAG TPA: ferritin [Actinomycetota bacterium]|nr:ferritin [Actinomycetota bacterium]
MPFSERTREAMNQQLNLEIKAFYAYLAMSDYFDSVSLPGFSQWMFNQSQEEWTHALKFRAFIQDRGGRVSLRQIPEPTAEFESSLEVFERALENEEEVSRSISDIYALAEEEKDFATQAFLNWFVTEQVEEEKTMTDIIDWLKRIGDSPQGLFMLDEKLAQGGLTGSGVAAEEPPA